MKTEQEYNIIMNERLDQARNIVLTRETLLLLLYLSYVEGGMDSDKDQLEKLQQLTGK